MHTFIKNLLNGQSVEWKTLGEVAELKRGRVMSKEYLADNKGDYSVYSSQTANNGEIGKINTFDFEGEFVTWTTDGANAGTVFYRNGKFSITNVCGLVILNDLNQLNYKFIYYWLCIEAKKYVYLGMGNPKLMSNQMEKIKIPIPPLSVQQKIAQILDAFTAITAELTAELTAEYTLRQKQYQYYRDKLLTFDEKIQRKKLVEILDIKRGKRLVRSELQDNEKYPVYQNSLQPLGYYSQYNCRANMSFIISAGNAGEVGYSDVDFWSADDCYYFDCPQDLLKDRFLYYVLMSQKNQIARQVRKASVPRLGRNSVENLIIPIPPLATQEKIVAILDKFETLANSITDGLPKEIALRQKQYEYYRQILLGFEKEQSDDR